MDELGLHLGCNQSLAVSPYCSNPEVRILAPQLKPLEMMVGLMHREIEATPEMAIGVTGPMSGTDLVISLQDQFWKGIPSCQQDESCVLSAVQGYYKTLNQLKDTTPTHVVREMEKEQERQRELARVEEEAQRKLQEEERLKEEARETLNRQRLAAAERHREYERQELRKIDVDSLLPPGSQLRPLLYDGFEAFDRKVAIPLAAKIGGDAAALTTAFTSGGSGAGISRGIMNNRKNLVAAAYGLSRRNAIGFCGDQAVSVYRRSIPGMETRTLSGISLSRTDGVDVYVEVPRPFVRFVEKSHFEGNERRFSAEIERMGGCNSPVFKHIEQNIIAFARGRPFTAWPR